MATVEVFTKTRMLAIENATVVDGEVDVNGDLILTTKAGTPINAGNVVGPQGDPAPILPPASTTVAGPVQLATPADVLAGTPATEAVTPDGAKQMFTYSGVIDPAWSMGKPNVTLDSAQAYSGVVSAFLPGNDDESIMAGASVILTRTNKAEWVIIGTKATKPRFMRQIECSLEPGSGWYLYSDGITQDTPHEYGEGPADFGSAAANADSSKAGKFYVACTSTGIATLSGLLKRNSVPAVNSIIGRFPIGLAPARNQVLTVDGNNQHAQVAVCTDGTIRFVSGASVAYLSINSVRWRTAASVAAGIAPFTALTLLSGWASKDTAYWTGEPGSVVHTPGYTVDADMVYVFEGAVAATVAKASNSDIAVVTALTAARGTHYVVGTGVGYAYCRIGPSGGSGGADGKTIVPQATFSIGQYQSLANMIWLDTSSPTTSWITPQYVNAWTLYNPDWALPGFAKTPDGLCMGHGLWASGTLPGQMTKLPLGWRPRFRSIHSTVSNGGFSRADVGLGPGSQDQAVTASIGASGWFSLDGVVWPAYR